MIPSTKDTTLEYNKRNRVQKVIKDGKEVTYKYHGDELLYERTEKNLVNGAKETTRFYYDGDCSGKFKSNQKSRIPTWESTGC
jgi:YD repeat-containing protein